MIRPTCAPIVSLGIIGLGHLICPTPAHATVIGTIQESESKFLVDLINKAKHKIDIRCKLINDSACFAALQQARNRGVFVRIVVDTMTPTLAQSAALGSPRFVVHQLDKAHHGKYFAKQASYDDFETFRKLRSGKQLKRLLAPKSYAEIDSDCTWIGVARWSRQNWVGVNTLIVDTLHPYPDAGSAVFQQAWKNSTVVPENKQ